MRVVGARCVPLPRWWGAAVALASLPALADAWQNFGEPLAWRGAGRWYVDMPYHLALVGELSHRWPPHYPQVAGEPLSYHYLSHAWMAHLQAVSGVSADVVLMRAVPALMAVAVPVAIAAAGLRLTGLPAAGPVAVAVACWVGWMDVWGGSQRQPVLVYSPSLGFAVLLVMALLTLIVLRWRGDAARGSLALTVTLALVAGGAKATVLPLVVVGALAAAGVALLRRDPTYRRCLVDAAVTAVALGALMRLVLGSGGGLVVRPLDALAREWMGKALGPDAAPGALGLTGVTLVLVVAVLLPLAGGLAVLADPHLRWDPAVWMLLGVTAAANGALLVFGHLSGSQFYFPRTAAGATGVLVAWGLLHVTRGIGRVVPVALLAGAAGLGLAGLLAPADRGSVVAGVAVLVLLVAPVALVTVAVSRSTRRPRAGVAVALVALPVLGLPVTLAAVDPVPPPREVGPRSAYAFTADQRRAARFIRDHSDPDDVVTSNRHCVRPRMRVCESRRFWVAAYTERRVLVEGWQYTARANATEVRTSAYAPRTSPFWEPALLALNDGFYSRPTAAAARRLHELGVRWLFVDRTVQPVVDLSPYAERRLRTRHAEVWQLRG
jgi:hypothetical protein